MIKLILMLIIMKRNLLEERVWVDLRGFGLGWLNKISLNIIAVLLKDKSVV